MTIETTIIGIAIFIFAYYMTRLIIDLMVRGGRYRNTHLTPAQAGELISLLMLIFKAELENKKLRHESMRLSIRRMVTEYEDKTPPIQE